MATQQAQSPPDSPQGYTNQVRLPRSDSHYFTRLACLLLNHLQDDLAPLSGRGTNFFNVSRTHNYLLYERRFSSDSQAAERVGLDSLMNLHDIKIKIVVHKNIDDTYKSYQIEAIADCYDSPHVPGRAPPSTMWVGGKRLHVAICIGWKVDALAFSLDHDTMDWPDALRYLRRASKKIFNRYGEYRSDEEAMRVVREQSPMFAIGQESVVPTMDTGEWYASFWRGWELSSRYAMVELEDGSVEGSRESGENLNIRSLQMSLLESDNAQPRLEVQRFHDKCSQYMTICGSPFLPGSIQALAHSAK